MRIKRLLPYVVGAAIAVTFPLWTGMYQQQVAVTILIYLTLALSWDMLLRSGQLNFGTAGFFGIGSYTAVLLFLNLGVPPLLSIALGGLIAGVVALFLGLAVLRLRGMYFAITTLGVASIFQVVARNIPSLTGGPEGKMLPTAIFRGNVSMAYWLVLGVALLAVVVSEVFERTRVRLALTSMRNNEWVARSSGIDVFKYLVFMFTVTSIIQGIAGGTYAHVYGFVAPEATFHVNFLLLPLAMALLGGIYGTWGPVIGALILGILSEYLKLQIPYGHLLVYGGIIVVVTLFAPHGVVGLVKAGLQKWAAERGPR
ncbi:MAG: branched-chain amino acid ABC transporter permease [Candidatus Bipolaricaulis sp.]|jgi:branched-chain amino acid transport system permease protein|uniref:ABC-type branched-chain amino acid transport system, permease component n=1 Tax=Candidatus Bipolaricaulis anaerobius TaxID=2026885 RepID=A0A2X3KWZ4_9BACT|nr:branched-chain amino acid ABC transporter permease [Candidatus Bipolaricaulis anaerobius]MBP7726035.1 branched-chain amino acid ABC transporter permease [Candidatus Bipolaricaulis sp.]SQD93108.1 ABC-type branched-chain amino acid transport system, permease component [Candidatus Bipolaricaulis anaerobius]